MNTHVQAPYHYIEDYYESVLRKNEKYPDVARFWLSAMNQIDGDSVLNVGCGPMLYDNLAEFSKPPKNYVGFDLNQASFDFMEQSDNTHLASVKAAADALDTTIDTICGDIFDYTDAFTDRFDSILGVGFFATFEGRQFDDLLQIMFRALKPGGQLLKLTWHGPHRGAEETRKKLVYRFDNREEPTPEYLVDKFERAGFELRHQSILECSQAAIGFEAIQVCHFGRPD
jgi:SAM-dependent methyltransferase